MCGRFLNKLPAAEIARIFGTRNPLPNYPARFDIAPTDPVLAMRFNPETKVRTLDVLRWKTRRSLGNGGKSEATMAETYPFHLFPPYMLQGPSPDLVENYRQWLSLPQVAAARRRGETSVEIEIDLGAALKVGASGLRMLLAFVKR
jgi:hypothetical protein